MTENQLKNLVIGDTVAEYHNGHLFQVLLIIDIKSVGANLFTYFTINGNAGLISGHILLDDRFQVEIKKNKFIKAEEELL